MKNSFHSDNFICLINATSQALTLSNNLTQSPSVLQSRLIRKVHHIGCIRLIFCVCCSISMSLLLQRCFFNIHEFQNPSSFLFILISLRFFAASHSAFSASVSIISLGTGFGLSFSSSATIVKYARLMGWRMPFSICST